MGQMMGVCEQVEVTIAGLLYLLPATFAQKGCAKPNDTSSK